MSPWDTFHLVPLQPLPSRMGRLMGQKLNHPEQVTTLHCLQQYPFHMQGKEEFEYITILPPHFSATARLLEGGK